MFTQDKNDDFDWTRHSAATRDTKYTPNTGPSGDRSGSKQGKSLKTKLDCSPPKVQIQREHDGGKNYKKGACAANLLPTVVAKCHFLRRVVYY